MYNTGVQSELNQTVERNIGKRIGKAAAQRAMQAAARRGGYLIPEAFLKGTGRVLKIVGSDAFGVIGMVLLDQKPAY